MTAVASLKKFEQYGSGKTYLQWEKEVILAIRH